MAGDLVDRGRVQMLEPVLAVVRSAWGKARLIAVFGNEEYHSVRDDLVKRYRDVLWLDDDKTVVDCNGLRVSVVGTSGSLDRLTRWQERNMPWLKEVYSSRPKKLARLIDEARSEADVVVLVSHYALSRATIRGERPSIWPELYSSSMEELLRSKKPDIAIHGHAHKGTPRAIVSGVPVYNVALPLNRSVTVIRLSRGLAGFI